MIVSTLNRIVPVLLLLLTGSLFAASPVKAASPRLDSFAGQALATCSDDGFVVSSETPDVSHPAGAGGEGTLLGSGIAVAFRAVWRMSFAGPVAQPAPDVSHAPCAEPSTGPPTL